MARALLKLRQARREYVDCLASGTPIPAYTRGRLQSAILAAQLQVCDAAETETDEDTDEQLQFVANGGEA